MKIRPATADDCKSFWGSDTPVSMRAFVAEQDGVVKAVAGLAFMPSSIVAFSDQSSEMPPHSMTAMRMARKIIGVMKDIKSPVYCVADKTKPNACSFLEHIGFTPLGDRNYIWSKK